MQPFSAYHEEQLWSRFPGSAELFPMPHSHLERKGLGWVSMGWCSFMKPSRPQDQLWIMLPPHSRQGGPHSLNNCHSIGPASGATQVLVRQDTHGEGLWQCHAEYCVTSSHLPWRKQQSALKTQCVLSSSEELRGWSTWMSGWWHLEYLTVLVCLC